MSNLIYEQVPIGKNFRFWYEGTAGAITVEVFNGEIQYLHVDGISLYQHNIPYGKCNWNFVSRYLDDTIELDDNQFQEMARLLSDTSQGLVIVKNIICGRIKKLESQIEIEKEKWSKFL